MRVPDEGKYKKGQKKLEDLVGWQFCPHCDKCTLTTQTQIYTDGYFFCLFFRKWKRGDDLVEFRCRGYKTKNCHTCKLMPMCRDKFIGKFCEDYKRFDINHHGMYHMGRRNVMRDTDPYAIRAEEYYIGEKKKHYATTSGTDDTGSGGNEAGERQERPEEDEELGTVQIPDSDKENQVAVPPEEED